MSCHTRLAIALILMLAAVPASAARFDDVPTDTLLTAVVQSQILWGDDFDNYCTGAAEWVGYPIAQDYGLPTETWVWPAGCAVDGTAVIDQAAFEAKWPLVDNNGVTHKINKAAGTGTNRLRFNKPYSMRFPGGSGVWAGRHSHDLTSAIEYKGSLTGQTVNGVNGTANQPLYFKFFMNLDGNGVGAEANAMWYTELSWGSDRAPTDFVVKDCSPLTVGPYPIVCQQQDNASISVDHPALKTDIHASVAVGALAVNDGDPCNTDTGTRPTNYHLVFFDGVKWINLRSGMFPGNGDFVIDSPSGPVCWITLEITDTVFRLRYVKDPNGTTPNVNEATIPRQYTGPFNTISVGPGKGCPLDPVTGECTGPYEAFHWGVSPEVWANAHYDSMLLQGGQLVSFSTDGACCDAIEGTCTLASATACQQAGGRFDGPNTACGDIPCCAHMPFDANRDGDVDMDDFAVLQRCLTAGGGSIGPDCPCLDSDASGTIDAIDLEHFLQCASGAGVSFNPACVIW